MSKIKNISILGCGWYGFALAQSLLKDGFVVKGSSTSPAKLDTLSQAGIQAFEVRFEAEDEGYYPEFFDCDLLIICIPPGRASDKVGSYPAKVKKIIDVIETTDVKRALFISSTSVYGDQNTEVTEDTAAVPETESGKAILQAENLLRSNGNFKTTILRFAGLIGPGRNPGRFFAGKKAIPNGEAPVNLIHLEDCVGITKAIIEKEAFGYTFNASSPEHPPKSAFYTRAAVESNLEAPEFIGELKSWKIVKSGYVEDLLEYRIGALLR